MSTYDGYPLILARHYTVGRLMRPRVIVIHTTESPEGSTTADVAVANFFHGQPANTANPTSPHCVIDVDSVTQTVRDEDTAYAAGTHGNRMGLHAEHIGYAAQTTAQWADAYSRGELEKSAQRAAAWCRKWRIVPVKLSAGNLVQIEQGRDITGFAGHRDFTAAFPGETTHSDPGLFFPWSAYLSRVADILHPVPVPPVEEDDDMSRFMYLGSDGKAVLVQDGTQVQLEPTAANEFSTAGVLYVNAARASVAQEAAYAQAYGPLHKV